MILFLSSAVYRSGFAIQLKLLFGIHTSVPRTPGGGGRFFVLKCITANSFLNNDASWASLGTPVPTRTLGSSSSSSSLSLLSLLLLSVVSVLVS